MNPKRPEVLKLLGVVLGALTLSLRDVETPLPFRRVDNTSRQPCSSFSLSALFQRTRVRKCVFPLSELRGLLQQRQAAAAGEHRLSERLKETCLILFSSLACQCCLNIHRSLRRRSDFLILCQPEVTRRCLILRSQKPRKGACGIERIASKRHLKWPCKGGPRKQHANGLEHAIFGRLMCLGKAISQP